ncbi:Rid family detoxifying hydrolase [Buchnera aphidicola]|uniref:Rid family detoxifying hydrolase n=1 Tax=Buchnera aphidicola TaxID=9 RepID=UPI0031B886B3
MKKIINTKKSPLPIGPYQQGILIENTLFISGQIAINENNQIISDDIGIQTRKILENIKNIVQTSNLKINDIVKINIFTTCLDKINIINSIYEKFFISNQSIFPARTCIEVRKLPKNAKIEIDVIAIK